MGDIYIQLVPLKVTKSEVDDLSKKVINQLVNKGVIKYSDHDNIYKPGANYYTITEIRDDHFLGLVNNKVEINKEHRVFYGRGVDTIKCPICKENIIETINWSDAIEEWQKETGKDIVLCPKCKTSNSIKDYTFEPAWAFGEMGLTFWNWPPLNEIFLKELESILGKEVKTIYGKL